MTRLVRGVLWTAIALAAVNLLLPFVGPAIGFGMGPDPAWTITSGRVVRHVIPNLVLIGGAWLMLRSEMRSTRLIAGIAAILAGGFVAVGPHILAVESGSQFIRRFVYHSGTGVVLAGLAGVALGALLVTYTVDRPEGASERSGSETIGV